MRKKKSNKLERLPATAILWQLEENRKKSEAILQLYREGKQDVTAYRKAFGLPPETIEQQRRREQKVKELEARFTRDFLFIDPPLVEWNCKGFLGYKK